MRQRWLFTLLTCICVAASAFDIYVIARTIPLSSDVVHSFLEAQAILHGNILLSGWHIGSDDFVFTDAIPFAAIRTISGTRPAALFAFAALTYVLIVVTCLFASLRSMRLSRDNVVSLATVILLLGLPATGEYRPLLMPGSHTAPALFGLVALLLLDRLSRSDRIGDQALMATAFIMISSAAVASDPFAIIFAFGPALVILASDLLLHADRRTAGLTALVVAGCALGKLIPLAIAAAGGFITDPNVSLALVQPGHLGRTLQGVFFGLLYNADADIFGQPAFAAGTLAHAARLAGWVLGGLAVYSRFRSSGHARCNLLDRLLMASIVLVAVGCTLSEMFDNNLGDGIYLFRGGAATRYLLPITIFGAVLVARSMPDLVSRLPTRTARFVLASGLIAGAGGLLTLHTAQMTKLAAAPPWIESSTYAQVGRWLKAQNLVCGVGGYWSASIITALTRGDVTVRAVAGPPHGKLAPIGWAADANWYHTMRKPMFVIWQPNSDNAYNVSVETITATYGAPLRIDPVAGFQVAVLRRPSIADNSCDR